MVLPVARQCHRFRSGEQDCLYSRGGWHCGRQAGRARSNGGMGSVSFARVLLPLDRIVIEGLQRARPGSKVTPEEGKD